LSKHLRTALGKAGAKRVAVVDIESRRRSSRVQQFEDRLKDGVLPKPYNCRTLLDGGAYRMTSTTKARGKARLEARIDADLDDLISEAADRLDVTKTAFVSEALREAALKVIARSVVTMMDPKVFDSMMASIDIADESSELNTLAALPRRITR
jgi:uncharacterized protein (DUF1778 family)